jgi:hypothetical protein
MPIVKARRRTPTVENGMSSRGSVPVPDPTERTREQLETSIKSLEDLFSVVSEGNKRVIEQRLDGMDEAILLVRASYETLPQYIKEVVGNLKELHEEKFLSIANQFTLRDVAVAAALKAAQEAVFAQQVANKEANNKMEAGFTKLIDSSGELLRSVREGFDGKIEDMKTRFGSIEARLTTIESKKIGQTEHKADVNVSFSQVMSAIAIVISISAIIAMAWLHH